MKYPTTAILVFLFPFLAAYSQSALPTPAEIASAHRWATAKFAGRVEEIKPDPAIVVLANHDAVQKNERNGRAMRMGDREFSRGLFCHAPSKLIVRLPGTGKSFTALAGVDSNEQTSGGRGSVDFSIHVGGAERFRSGVMREGIPGKSVNVELNGATEFELRIDETPDGISCDQADWADAKVILADGREFWLADLPLQESEGRAPLTTEPPFAFTYDGKPSADLLKTWKLERKATPGRRGDEADLTRSNPPPQVSGYEMTWTDPVTGLEVRLVGFQYPDFPTVEWTVYFKNTGTTDLPLLEDILALDTHIERSGSREFTLHHHKGTFVRADDFEPLTTTLAAKQELRFAPPAGRPLGHVFPYFNLEWQDEGMIAVVGWPGQWFAEFTRDNARGLHLVAGQERTHLRLKPGEEIRTPLVVLQFWKGGGWLRAQNVWRRWMVAHNIPRPGGEAPRPLLTPCSSHQFGEMIQADEASQKLFIDRYLEERLNPDYWWMDAGWYLHYGKGWPQVGTWEVDTSRFPRGLRAITDHAHAKGVKSIVWFEPERVTPGTFLYTNNPAWLLSKGSGQKLLDLGHPDARAWLINHVDQMLTEQGIDLYRQDYNVDPLNFWRHNDSEDRQGITENHYVTGYLEFWDALRQRHPGLLIDSCASGGHRNDLETMRRSLPFLRSDFIQDAVGNQSHTYGLSFWLPYHGTGTDQLNPYDLRSALACPHFIACWDLRDRKLDYNLIRKTIADWRGYADNYLGDYYPMTPYTTCNDAWIGWQFDQPEQGRGVVQAFRRANSVYESARFKLHGLEARASYLLTDLDSSGPNQQLSGRDLMDTGLLLKLAEQPSAKIVTYKKVP